MKVALQFATAMVAITAIEAESALRANALRQLEEVSDRFLSIPCIRVIYYR